MSGNGSKDQQSEASPPQRPELGENMNCPEVQYFLNESVSDVVFVVEGHRVPAIRQVLALRSQVFRVMLCGQFNEANDKEIVIKDTTVEAFKTMILFLYSNKLEFAENEDMEVIADVYRLADRYQLDAMIKEVKQHVIKMKLTVANLPEISRIAFMFEMKELMDRIKRWMEWNMRKILAAHQEELNHLNAITNNTLFEILVRTQRRRLRAKRSPTQHLGGYLGHQWLQNHLNQQNNAFNDG